MKIKWYMALAPTFLLILPLIMLFSSREGSAQVSPEVRIIFEGGPGDAMDNAIVIKGAPNNQQGIDAEYYYLEKKFGRFKVDWKLNKQRLLHKGNKKFDLMQIELKDGTRKDIYFDITDFFGKL